ncbi:beta-N-acetylhexosaminidase [Bauldia sp.]|uniref:beta-N-acetylhexosaminidase n=1 Tax=Bauldia sp. TaxID=2575872 RepID=UPI003BAAB829
MAAKAFISGCSGLRLTAEERAFFAAEQPWGLILFQRNCEAPEQVAALVEGFRAAVQRADAPVLIDQEGGRVRRLKPPYWPDYPACRSIGRVAEDDAERGIRAAWLQGRLIAGDLAPLGITIDCAPVLDVIAAGASEAIGDRSFGSDPGLVTSLGRAMADGLIAGGVCPVVKHSPGQGRAVSDSHIGLPIVDAPLDRLVDTDFPPFVALADLPAAMTAHIVYTAVDPTQPATTSSVMIRDIIRQRIGFDGLLMSDDISMNALAGSYSERATAIHDAGCDIVLHCNGRMDEVRAVAEVAPELGGRSAERATRLLASIRPPTDFDPDAGREELLALVASVGWAEAS